MAKTHSLIGPAALVLSAARAVVAKRERVALLFDGDPGTGKTTIANQIALELVDGAAHAIEAVNRQSLSIDVVRAWGKAACYGNLFAAWTVKRVDELDHASSSATAELLTLLDTMPAHYAIIATTNDLQKLRSVSKGRLESRFIRLQVDAPTIAQTATFLRHKYAITMEQARTIARGAVPDGVLDGCNVRTALNDAEALSAVKEALARA